jgi:sensor histidine kinase regulating citrate/malate metabolism
MGLVYADITLINSGDLEMVKRKLMDKDEVKQIVVNMMVDSGAYMMAINETIQEQLDLSFIEKRKAIMADGSVQEYDVVGPIVVKFKNRTATCNAFVLKGNNEPLLGAIPMEEMPVPMPTILPFR